jgi:hypothetical protein
MSRAAPVVPVDVAAAVLVTQLVISPYQTRIEGQVVAHRARQEHHL